MFTRNRLKHKLSRDSRYWECSLLNNSIFASVAQDTLVKANLRLLMHIPLNVAYT